MTEPVPFILHYMRYHSKEECEADTLEEAVSQARWMQDDGQGSPGHVAQGGATLLDYDALQAAISAHRYSDETP